jgi:hypothetical protein
MTPKSSPDLQGTKPGKDKARQTEEAIIEGADTTEDAGSDLVRGEGGAIDLPVNPGDMSKDD